MRILVRRGGLKIKGGGQELILLEEMDGEGACGGGSGGATACVAEIAPSDRAKAEGEVKPCAHIFGLFLAPNEFGRGAVEGKEIGQFLFVERINLFETEDGGVAEAVFFAELGEVVVNLARAKNDAGGAPGDEGIREDFLEGAAGEIDRGAGGAGIA